MALKISSNTIGSTGNDFYRINSNIQQNFF